MCRLVKDVWFVQCLLDVLISAEEQCRAVASVGKYGSMSYPEIKMRCLVFPRKDYGLRLWRVSLWGLYTRDTSGVGMYRW